MDPGPAGVGPGECLRGDVLGHGRRTDDAPSGADRSAVQLVERSVELDVEPLHHGSKALGPSFG
jgi:hypothetical protein